MNIHDTARTGGIVTVWFIWVASWFATWTLWMGIAFAVVAGAAVWAMVYVVLWFAALIAMLGDRE